MCLEAHSHGPAPPNAKLNPTAVLRIAFCGLPLTVVTAVVTIINCVVTVVTDMIEYPYTLP